MLEILTGQIPFAVVEISFSILLIQLMFVSEDNFPTDIKNCYLYPRDSTVPIIATNHVSFAGQVVAIVVAGEYLVKIKRFSEFECLPVSRLDTSTLHHECSVSSHERCKMNTLHITKPPLRRISSVIFGVYSNKTNQ